MFRGTQSSTSSEETRTAIRYLCHRSHHWQRYLGSGHRGGYDVGAPHRYVYSPDRLLCRRITQCDNYFVAKHIIYLIGLDALSRHYQMASPSRR